MGFDCQYLESMKTAEPIGESVLLKDFRRSIFPFLESYSPTSFSLGWQEFLFFFLWLQTNKWILDYDLRFSKMCFCNVLPLAWSQHLRGIHCMDLWKSATKDAKLFKFYIFIFSKFFDLWQRRKIFILTMLSSYQIQPLCLPPSTLNAHCSKISLHRSRIWGYLQLNMQLIHTTDPSDSGKAL